MTAGGAVFARLKALGVRVVFANSGTDFPPIIEGLAEAAAGDVALPDALVMPHEHVALGMAQGWYLATGETPAVMLHTNVGLANGAIGTINAATDQVPMILMSGRTPTTERGRFGSRTVPIGWGQEMRDQTALVREACKWDYELRFPEQVGELLDRAHAIANSTPRGPVYLSLPRETLCEACPTEGLDALPSMRPAQTGPRTADIAAAADILTRASRPLIFAQRGAGSAAGFAALQRIADAFVIPVCHYWAVSLGLPTDHPMCVGADPEPWLSEADAVLVIDSLAPWSPQLHGPRPGVPVIQLGPDPLYARFPVRNFRADLAIACETAEGLAALAEAMAAVAADGDGARDMRHAAIAMRTQEIRARTAAAARPAPSGRMTKAFGGATLSQAIAGRRATVLSELGCPLDSLTLRDHDSWRQEPHSGGLGWSLPCAMGLKLGDPDRLVVATMGDGSYMFANPTACHQAMEAYGLPVLAVVLNNGEWGAVRHSVAGLYPDGHAVRANRMPLTALTPSPDFTKTAEASRAWARRVEQPEALAPALDAAIEAVTAQRRPALLDVAIAG
ncbi:MAG: thiamine pyrophosphate-requiring protein [Alphaproteobacteria bacterium]